MQVDQHASGSAGVWTGFMVHAYGLRKWSGKMPVPHSIYSKVRREAGGREFTQVKTHERDN
jgi:hypothetical protein